MCVALSLANVHVIKWQCPLKLVRSTWSTPYCKGNKTKWDSAIGYLVVEELCVALSLADIHVIKLLFHSNMYGPRGEILTAPNLA